ncbi:MAG: hypothetical protein ABI119_03375 [Gemmatimonadaceae bacterium]
MTYLLVVIGVVFALGGGYGVAHGDGGGWPILVIGVAVLGYFCYLGFKRRAK